MAKLKPSMRVGKRTQNRKTKHGWRTHTDTVMSRNTAETRAIWKDSSQSERNSSTISVVKVLPNGKRVKIRRSAVVDLADEIKVRKIIDKMYTQEDTDTQKAIAVLSKFTG